MKIIRFLDDRFEEVLSVILLAVMVAIVFLQVIMRYVFKASLYWSEEMARYLFLWLIWVGAGWATKIKAHISIDIFVTRMKGKAQKYANFVAFLVWFLFAVLLAYLSTKLTFMIFERGQVSAALRMPMGYAYASIPFGVILMVFRMIQHFIKDLKAAKGKNLNAEQAEGGEKV